MGKKDKKVESAAPLSESEKFKEEGNKAFMDKKYESAVDFYTSAIEASPSPNAIYFANRANALHKLGDFQKSIENCEEAIAADKTYVKAYYRKALA